MIKKPDLIDIVKSKIYKSEAKLADKILDKIKEKDEQELLSKIILSKISFSETTINNFVEYVASNQQKFRILKSNSEVQIFLIKGEINNDLINIFNLVGVSFDLIYFKHAIFNINNGTIDILFDSLSRCQPEISKKMINILFSKLSVN